MQFTTNKRIIDRYFDAGWSMYCTYDIDAGLIKHYLFQKQLSKPSDVIKKVRAIYVPMEYHRREYCLYKQIAIVLSIRQFRKLKQRDAIAYMVLSPQAVTNIVRKRTYIYNSRYKNMLHITPKRYDKEHLWLKKHKMI